MDFGKLKRMGIRLRNQGIPWLLEAARDRILPKRPSFCAGALSSLAGGTLLEIGGPSRLFSWRGALPAYSQAARVDNVNFAANTTWEGELSDMGHFEFRRGAAPGRQFIREAGALIGIPESSYDGVISSHCLEHLANPLKALKEWHRVTRAGGMLLLIVPDPARSFDHRRPITLLSHLAADRDACRTEDDESHFEEVLSLHDLTLDPAAGTHAEFRRRVLNNTQLRCVHHHVFDEMLLSNAVETAGWIPIACETFAPIHIGILCKAHKP